MPDRSIWTDYSAALMALGWAMWEWRCRSQVSLGLQGHGSDLEVSQYQRLRQGEGRHQVGFIELV